MGQFPNPETQFSSNNQPKNNGRPKGSRNLATIIRETLEGGMDWTKVPVKNNQEVAKKYGKQGWEAIIHVAAAQAMAGNIKAMEWLRKAGYGNSLDITTGGESLNTPFDPEMNKKIGEFMKQVTRTDGQ